MEPLFHQLDVDRFVASPLTAGPWSENAQHGSPVAALMLHCLERAAGSQPHPVARVTVELLRRVPVAELSVTTKLVRPGSRVQYLEAQMHHRGELVAAASAWTILGNAPEPTSIGPAPPRPPRSTGRSVEFEALRQEGFHSRAVEVDFVSGAFHELGPGTAWVRLLTSVVDDHPVSPAQRALVAADLGNGLSSVFDPAEVSFINPDLTLYLNRTPRGEWIALSSTTHAGSGYGFAESQVFDGDGLVGRSMQSLLLHRREG